MTYFHFYLIQLQIPGLIVEPFIFTIILYFLAELRPTVYAFVMTSIVTIIVMNIATACGKYLMIKSKQFEKPANLK